MVDVAVVGAGSAGLDAAQALAGRGSSFAVFEAGSGVGGNWRVGNDSGHSSGYESLRANTSRLRTRYTSLEWPRSASQFPHHTEMLAYLESFTDRFALRPHIRFKTPVDEVLRGENGGWVVRTPHGQESFDHLVVATGYNSTPVTPDGPGSFDGSVLHAHDFRSIEPFRGRDVVVVGVGCSATEIAHEASGVARSVTVAIRSASYIMARRLGRVPVDWFDSKAGSFVPWSLRRHLFKPLVDLAGGSQTRAGIPAPSGRPGDKPLAVSDHFISSVRSGAIAVAPPLESFDGSLVRFADGREQRADVVLFATGYDAEFPFLPGDVSRPSLADAPLYRGIVHVEEDSLFFLGLVFGHGALLPMFEAQAHWVAEVVAGNLRLPTAEVMRASVEADHEVRRRNFDPRYAIAFDRQTYVRRLASEARAAARHPGVSPRAARATT